MFKEAVSLCLQKWRPFCLRESLWLHSQNILSYFLQYMLEWWVHILALEFNLPWNSKNHTCFDQLNYWRLLFSCYNIPKKCFSLHAKAITSISVFNHSFIDQVPCTYIFNYFLVLSHASDNQFTNFQYFYFCLFHFVRSSFCYNTFPFVVFRTVQSHY